MAGTASLQGSTDALNAVTKRATVTTATVYSMLVTAIPADDDTLAEVAELGTAGYARQATAWDAPAGNPRVTSNTDLEQFTFSADPASVVGVVVTNQSSGTSGDWYMAFDTNDVDAGASDTIEIQAGGLDLTGPA
jgi:hypothetical protein